MGGAQARQLVHIAVRDTGIGISEESKAKLFQCFRQGSESMSRKYGGTGARLLPQLSICVLGMAICAVGHWAGVLRKS